MATLSALRMTDVRPMASSPTRLRAKASAHHDAFGIAPRLELEEAPDDERELLGEVLDRPLHDAGRLGITLDEQRVELLLADILGGLVAEGIAAGLAQRSCASCP